MARKSKKKPAAGKQAAPPSEAAAQKRAFLHRIGRLLPHYSELRAHWDVFLLCAAAGLLMRLPYPRFDWWWVAWVGLVPYFHTLRRGLPMKIHFYSSWLFGFCFYYSNISWLNILLYYNLFVPAGIFCMGLAMGAVIGVFGVGAVQIERRVPRLSFLLIPALWTAIEFWRGAGKLAFPWTYLAHSQFPFKPIIQMCDVTGMWGLTFLVALVNWALARAIPLSRKQCGGSPAQRIVPLAAAVVMFAAAFLYGQSALQRDYGNGKSFKVGIIQPGIPQKQKFASYAHPDLDVRRRLMEEINVDAVERIESFDKSKAGLLVLPESAFPNPYFSLNKTLIKELKRLSRESGTSILFGATEFSYVVRDGIPAAEPEPGAQTAIYNCAYLYTPDMSVDSGGQVYRKMLLVPFGETVPYLDVIPGFQKYVVGLGSFMPGIEYTIFKADGVKFGTAICFESVFPGLFREYNRRGAQFDVVITNDGWYETSAGPYQHFAMSGFRAVEGRRAIVRAANNGISGLFDAHGRIVDSLPLNARDSLAVEVPLSDYTTIYMRFGDWFAWLCVAGLIAAVIILFIPRNKKLQTA